MKRIAVALAVLGVLLVIGTRLPADPLAVMPSFTNLDANPQHREVTKFFRTMRLVERLEILIPSYLVPTLEAATVQTVMTEVSRGTSAGALTIGAGITGPILFTVLSSEWANDDTPGRLFLTASVDRSFDNGATWLPQYGFGGANQGRANCTPGPLPGPGGKVETCTPRLKVLLDGVSSIWRWTLTPQVDGVVAPFVWGASATF